MTDFDSLREDIAGIFDSVVRHSEAQNRLHDAVLVQVDRLWQDNAELRDELHALANRVEALTRAFTAEPIEVAQAIVTNMSDREKRTLREKWGVDRG